MSQKMKGVLLASGGASLWGGSGAAAQYLFSETDINTNWLAAMRLLIAGLLLLMWSVYRTPHRDSHPVLTTSVYYCVAGDYGTALAESLRQYFGRRRVNRDLLPRYRWSCKYVDVNATGDPLGCLVCGCCSPIHIITPAITGTV